MRVFGLVSPRETGRAFLCVVVTSRLLNIEVGGRHDDAVCGHFVAGLQLNDIANDELPDGDSLHLAALAAEHGERLLAV